MFIKIIGSLLFISASLSVGCRMSKSLRRRRDFLKAFIAFLTSLATEIRYNSEDIFTLVEKYSDCRELFAFSDISPDKGQPFETQWIRCIPKISDTYSLRKTDISLIREFGSQLGKTDVEGQLSYIEFYKTLFGKQLANSEEIIKNKSKLYIMMGLFVGTTVVLVLI